MYLLISVGILNMLHLLSIHGINGNLSTFNIVNDKFFRNRIRIDGNSVCHILDATAAGEITELCPTARNAFVKYGITLSVGAAGKFQGHIAVVHSLARIGVQSDQVV